MPSFGTSSLDVLGVEVLTSNNFLFTSGLTCIPSITSLCGTSCFISLNSKYVSLLDTRREHHVVSHAHSNGHSKAFFFPPPLCLFICFTEGRVHFHVPEIRFKCQDISLLSPLQIPLLFIQGLCVVVAFFVFCSLCLSLH